MRRAIKKATSRRKETATLVLQAETCLSKIQQTRLNAKIDAKNLATLYKSLPHPDWLETFERVFLALREQYQPFYLSEFESAFYKAMRGQDEQ